MKNAVVRIVTVVVVLAAGYWIVSGIISGRRTEAEKKELEVEKQQSEAKKQELEEVEKRLQIEKSIKGMIAKHNASTDWRKIFNVKDGSLNLLYSVEVQDALTDAYDRPIMFLAFISDVTRESDEYYVHFYFLESLYSMSDISSILHCTQDQVNEIMLNQRGFPESNYAVIAKISSAKKATFGLSCDEDQEVYITLFSNSFIARGRCLDLLFVGDYKPEDSHGAKDVLGTLTNYQD
ncbi:MAG TPA: hypothetical protein DIU00_12170 [Phycisphaerales bacterium]|nr:hypothetical protein [Phycisphaerales bacterium]